MFRTSCGRTSLVAWTPTTCLPPGIPSVEALTGLSHAYPTCKNLPAGIGAHGRRAGVVREAHRRRPFGWQAVQCRRSTPPGVATVGLACTAGAGARTSPAPATCDTTSCSKARLATECARACNSTSGEQSVGRLAWGRLAGIGTGLAAGRQGSRRRHGEPERRR